MDATNGTGETNLAPAAVNGQTTQTAATTAQAGQQITPGAGTQTTPEGQQQPAGQYQQATPPTHPTTKPPPQQQTTTPSSPPEKTFTQKELDFFIGERVKRATEGMPSKDELAAFKTWQESQKTEAQKSADALAAAQQQAANFQAELTKLYQIESVRKTGVDDAFIGYVQYEAINRAAIQNITFDEALTTFMTETEGKYKKQDTRQVTVDTGGQQNPAVPPPFILNFTGVRPKPQN